MSKEEKTSSGVISDFGMKPKWNEVNSSDGNSFKLSACRHAKAKARVVVNVAAAGQIRLKLRLFLHFSARSLTRRSEFNE
jgi:hypothetical protein